MIQDHEKNPMHAISFQALVEGVRSYCGFTQAELGQRMNGRSAKTISRWETGATLPDEVPIIVLALKGLVMEKWLADAKQIPFFLNVMPPQDKPLTTI